VPVVFAEGTTPSGRDDEGLNDSRLRTRGQFNNEIVPKFDSGQFRTLQCGRIGRIMRIRAPSIRSTSAVIAGGAGTTRSKAGSRVSASCERIKVIPARRHTRSKTTTTETFVVQRQQYWRFTSPTTLGNNGRASLITHSGTIFARHRNAIHHRQHVRRTATVGDDVRRQQYFHLA